jgi:2-polyprenylphenol 6-hydroxylase
MAPTVYDYQHRAVVAVLHSDLSAPHTAWQWLGAHGQGHDVLALLPLPIANSAEARYGLVWSQPQAQAAQWVGKEAAMLAAVQARCGHSAGQLSLHSAVQQFPLYRTQATQITQGNIVLLGDSAHKIHPLAGQGLNLGFEDAFTLFAVIAGRENWRDLVDKRVLARYERQRASHVGAIDAVVHAIATRKHWPNSIQRALTAGLDISQQWPSLRQFVQSKVVQAMAA